MEGMERDCPLRRYEPLWGTWYVDGLLLTGHDLAVKGLDLESGRLTATGNVLTLRYSSALPSPRSLLKKLFK